MGKKTKSTNEMKWRDYHFGLHFAGGMLFRVLFQVKVECGVITGIAGQWHCKTATFSEYNTSLLRPVGQRPMGSAAKDTYNSLVIALLSPSPYNSRPLLVKVGGSIMM
jgi:hypothetical protein